MFVVNQVMNYNYTIIQLFQLILLPRISNITILNDNTLNNRMAINRAFQYVILTSKKYNIDESHSIKHSLDVYTNVKNIYNSELDSHPELVDQYTIICLSAILHDMCDKKYIDESKGILEMVLYMKDYVNRDDMNVITNIIQTMSYSKVKVNGYPNLKTYQLAYHIVQEADLLAAYDMDRCIIYGMMVESYTYSEAFQRAKQLFTDRVLKYREDKLFLTQYSLNTSLLLHQGALKRMNSL